VSNEIITSTYCFIHFISFAGIISSSDDLSLHPIIFIIVIVIFAFGYMLGTATALPIATNTSSGTAATDATPTLFFDANCLFGFVSPP
jgi:hypothetical protein